MGRDGRERLQALPGVEQASATCCVPAREAVTAFPSTSSTPSGKEPYHGGGGWATVSPGYFEVFKIPEDRTAFTDRDVAAAPAVVIINEAMAKEFGKMAIRLNDRSSSARGVMREFATSLSANRRASWPIRATVMNNDPFPEMFIPQAQVPDPVNALMSG